MCKPRGKSLPPEKPKYTWHDYAADRLQNRPDLQAAYQQMVAGMIDDLQLEAADWARKESKEGVDG